MKKQANDSLAKLDELQENISSKMKGTGDIDVNYVENLKLEIECIEVPLNIEVSVDYEQLQLAVQLLKEQLSLKVIGKDKTNVFTKFSNCLDKHYDRKVTVLLFTRFFSNCVTAKSNFIWFSFTIRGYYLGKNT